jgi:hypothetical protein
VHAHQGMEAHAGRMAARLGPDPEGNARHPAAPKRLEALRPRPRQILEAPGLEQRLVELPALKIIQL